MQQLKICRRMFMGGVLASATLGRALAEVPMQADVKQRVPELLERFAAAHPSVVRDFHIVTLAGNARPWLDTGIDLKKGDALTFLASGQVYLSRIANLWLLPRVVLWARTGDADVFRPGSETYSFRSADAGRLRLATLQGRWATPKGDHPAPAAYDAIEGAIDVVVIRWGDVTPEQGIAALAAFAPDEPALAAEQARLRAPVAMPHGFEPLWFVGSGDSFSQFLDDGQPAVALRSQQSGGIIRAPLDLPLAPGIHISWDWRVNQLPSSRAEDSAPTHQYASLAVEFEDGQDLSWYWSAALEPEKHYRCPFPTWPGETHLVVRSGSAEQGRWVGERRDVTADVAAVLTKAPARIKGVWLIASTVFGALPASVDFRRIAVTDARGKTLSIFPS